MEILHNIQASTVGDVGSGISRIYAALDGRQEDHLSRMIDVVSINGNVPIVILIDSRSIHSYIASNIVERCYLKKSKLEVTRLI